MRLEWVALPGLFFCAALGHAQVYRWVDASGGVHYSNTAPPATAQASIVDIPAQPGPPSAESAECHTLRCQAERADRRLEERTLLEAQRAAERAALAPRPVHGLEFRRYIAIERGMTEGDLLAVAGDPDLRSGGSAAITGPVLAVPIGHRVLVPARALLSLETWTYLPTVSDPFTTTVTLVGGRVTDVERVRKF
ncbi:MAG: DUF4124 domain-containing protein [Betaproteobacteria bacterium]|nr:DUF4124 domain-containing protein [Betaproteobacteria bacterium]